MSGATWGTWKTHGNAQRLMYFGEAKRGPHGEGQEVTLEASNGGVVMKSADRETKLIQANSMSVGFGNAHRFWAAPVPERKEQEKMEQNKSRKNLPGKAPGQVPAPSAHKSAQRPLCTCGCGLKVASKSSKFRQGHDARYVSKLVAMVLAGETTADNAIDKAHLVSIKLGDKTEKAVSRAIARSKPKAKDAEPEVAEGENSTGITYDELDDDDPDF